MNCKKVLIIFFLIKIISLCVFADLTKHFKNFLDTKYKKGTADRFARLDITSPRGSFGGKLEYGEKIKNNPIIFVHGLTLTAGLFEFHNNYFKKRNYKNSELYATTYSDGGKTMFYEKTMNCEDVIQIREFIKAVNAYTNKTVDIIAYSMGVAISRKAILGGKCVDTNYDLGPKITHLVNTYIAVAGVAYGYQHCFPSRPACNELNGMICTSDYMVNINNPSEGYEGKHRYAIYSTNDRLVGQKCCNHHCSELKNSHKSYINHKLNHIQIIFNTIELQYKIISKHTNVT